jgi:hypothetical protein
LISEPVRYRGQTEFLKGRDAARNHPQSKSHIAALQKCVSSQAGQVVPAEGKIYIEVLREALGRCFVEHAHH